MVRRFLRLFLRFLRNLLRVPTGSAITNFISRLLRSPPARSYNFNNSILNFSCDNASGLNGPISFNDSYQFSGTYSFKFLTAVIESFPFEWIYINSFVSCIPNELFTRYFAIIPSDLFCASEFIFIYNILTATGNKKRYQDG